MKHTTRSSSIPPAAPSSNASRRGFLKSSAGVAGALALSQTLFVRAASKSGPIHVASMFDVTGGLSIYGLPEMNVSHKNQAASMQQMIDAIKAETGFDPTAIARARLRTQF